ncbi:MAG TPA: cytochrome c-type biogenesis protein [Burkholderiales bacterium]
MKTLLVLLMLCISAMAMANTAQPSAEEVRLGKIAAELRCLVCQNQSIADSHADLAVDLRREIGEQIAAGRSDRQIIDYMVDRYGEFVLYRPPFKITTLLLWLGPALLLIVGVFALRRNLKTRRALVIDAPLDDEERRRAAALLATPEERDAS